MMSMLILHVFAYLTALQAFPVSSPGSPCVMLDHGAFGHVIHFLG